MTFSKNTNNQNQIEKMTSKDKGKDGVDINEASRDQKIRHSYNPENKKKESTPPLRLTQSQHFGKKPRVFISKVSTPTIVEAENSDDEDAEVPRGAELPKMEVIREGKRSGSKESLSKEKRRESMGSKTSAVSKKASVHSRGGFAFENPAYEGNLNAANSANGSRKTSRSSLAPGSFVRGGNAGDSVRSSAQQSVGSMEVQREQYCCFSRWSACEKRLALSVAVLAAVIVGLVIAVGYLAGKKGVDERFTWNF